jgi:hypothetical protein
MEGLFFQTERLAGAVGLEPTPSSLTVGILMFRMFATSSAFNKTPSVAASC